MNNNKKDIATRADIDLLVKQRAKSVATVMQIKIAQNKKPRTLIQGFYKFFKFTVREVFAESAGALLPP